MEHLFDQDPMSLSPEDRVVALDAAKRELARVEARVVRLIAALADDPYTGEPAPRLEKEYFTEQIKVTLGESRASVDSRVWIAYELTRRLVATLDALERGEITSRHARRLAEAAVALPDEDAAEVEVDCLAFAAGRDYAAFGRKVKREVLARDRRPPDEQLQDALAQRRVWHRPAEDGPLTFVGAVLPVLDGAAVVAMLDQVAGERQPDDARTVEQRRADALGRVARTYHGGGCLHCDWTGEPTGPRLHVQVTVALSTLLGLDEQPGELSGHGPISAALARQLANTTDASWRRLVTDDAGRLLDYGRSTYRPPVALRDHVVAKHRTCRFPGCHRPARRCDLDHVIAWAEGGETNASNLIPLCVRHHRLKHETGWSVRLDANGTVRWTSPTGQRYSVPAATYTVDATMCTRNDNAAPGDPIEGAAMCTRNDNDDDATADDTDAPPF